MESLTELSATRPKGLVVGVDIDDVLFPTAQGIINYYRERYEVEVPFEDFYSKDPTVWGVDDYSEAVQRVQAFLHSSDYFHQAPIEGAVEGVRELRQAGAYLIPVTGRDDEQSGATKESLDTFFPGLFSESAVFTNYFSSAKRRTKGDVCQELGISYQIDDYPVHLSGLAQHAIKGVLFGGYPWGKDRPMNEIILIANNWDEAPGVILSDHLEAQGGAT